MTHRQEYTQEWFESILDFLGTLSNDDMRKEIRQNLIKAIILVRDHHKIKVRRKKKTNGDCDCEYCVL